MEGEVPDERRHRHGPAGRVSAEAGRQVEAEAVHVVLLYPPSNDLFHVIDESETPFESRLMGRPGPRT